MTPITPIKEHGGSARPSSDRVPRHHAIDRWLHWSIAACVLALLTTSLLPIFGIKLNWVGPHWMIGIGLTLGVLAHVIRAWTKQSLRNMWIGSGEFVDSMSGEITAVSGKATVPAKIGKYSVAQKLFHFAMSSTVLLAIATGIIMMIGVNTPFWERNPYVVSENARGIVFVMHGFATLVSITLIIVHVYFALRPEKRYFTRSMIRGWITRKEYEEHHDPELWKANDK